MAGQAAWGLGAGAEPACVGTFDEGQQEAPGPAGLASSPEPREQQEPLAMKSRLCALFAGSRTHTSPFPRTKARRDHVQVLVGPMGLVPDPSLVLGPWNTRWDWTKERSQKQNAETPNEPLQGHGEEEHRTRREPFAHQVMGRQRSNAALSKRTIL